MHPIILFFEDHRDPIAKKIISHHLSRMEELQINVVALEIDKDTLLETYLDEVKNHCKLWSRLAALPHDEKEKMLKKYPEKKAEFQHNIDSLASRKSELELLLRVRQMNRSISLQGIDLVLRDIRALSPHEQLAKARTLQAEREQAMVNNLSELNADNGVVAILGLSHYAVATQLKQKGHDVFCFLPLSITTEEESVRSQFVKKIEQENESVSELTLLDARTRSIDEIWACICEKITPSHNQLRC